MLKEHSLRELNSSSFIFTYRGLFFVVLATFRPPAIGRAAYHYQITNRVSFSPFSISQQIFFDAMLSNRLPQVFVLLYFVLILAAASHYRTTPSEQVYQAVRKIFILILRNTSLVLFGEKILHLLTHTPTHAEYLIFPCCLTMVLFGSWRVVFFLLSIVFHLYPIQKKIRLVPWDWQ